LSETLMSARAMGWVSAVVMSDSASSFVRVSWSEKD
jgi:hypothetical protein